jgi:hypothetical protein
MRIERTPGRLVLRDSAAMVRGLGVAFVASGTFCLGGGVLGLGDAPVPAGARLALLVIGAAHLAGGLWTVHSHGATRAVFELASGRASVETRALFRTRREDFSIRHAAGVFVREEKDSDGDRWCTLHLLLRDGRIVRLNAVPARGPERLEQAAAALRELLPLPAARR